MVERWLVPLIPFPSYKLCASNRPGAVKGARFARRSEPLTARTDLESYEGEGKGIPQPSSHLPTKNPEYPPRQGESAEEYRARIDDYLRTVKDIKKSGLANYVAHRRVVLDLLKSAIQRLPDGGYARDDLIHTLIMPMRADSNKAGPDDSNLYATALPSLTTG